MVGAKKKKCDSEDQALQRPAEGLHGLRGEIRSAISVGGYNECQPQAGPVRDESNGVVMSNQNTMGPALWSSSFRKTYNNLVRAFALHGDSDGVVRTVQIMKENGMAFDDFIYNNLILVFGTNG